MTAEAFVQCRVAPATKAALRLAAERQQLTESALLKRMLDLMLLTATASPANGAAPVAAERASRPARLYVRLTTGDRQLLQERSAARCLAPATYASNLLRAHLRALTPLPEGELRDLRQSTRELAAIGRHLNQIARAINQGRVGAGVNTETLWGVIRMCEALRDHTRAYIRTNLASWESGNAASEP